jgi:putative nucleotidyltransferase with HDIG domain
MPNPILKFLPEIKRIRDKNIKEKTIATWEEAVKIGGWKYDDLEKIPFTLLSIEIPANLIEHTRAVTNTAIEVAKVVSQSYKEVKIDYDYLISGAILHDVGKLLEYKKEKNKISKSSNGKLLRHPISGAALAHKQNLPEEIVHIIAVHSHEGDEGYRSPEAIIVHHSDFINFEILGGRA